MSSLWEVLVVVAGFVRLFALAAWASHVLHRRRVMTRAQAARR